MNPLDYKQFTHILNFISDDTGLIQISEPVKFDAAEFVISQDDGYARDISYMSEEISLEFYHGLFEYKLNGYTYDNGIVVNNLTHALEQILRYNKEYGFQSKIEYILERDGVQFILGQLNFEGMETDESTYFKCKVIQSTKRALAKRREDTTIDMFSSEDLDGNEIAPIVSEKMLLQAKPFIQKSEFINGFKIENERFYAEEAAGQDRIYYYYNNCNVPSVYGIDDTLSYLSAITTSIEDPNDNLADNFRYLRAVNDLSNVSITIKDLTFSQDIDTDNGGDGYSSNKMVIQWGEAIDNLSGEIVLDSSFVTDSNGSYSFSIPEQTYNINTIQRDHYLWIYFRSEVRQSSDTPVGNPRIEAFTTISEYTVSIEATSVAIDTVIDVVRYIDLAKQSLKAINGMDLIAPEHEEGGKYHNLFATSGNLIRQRSDVPFYVNFKDRRENLVLMNSDIQINDNDAFCLRYDKFYSDVDNGSFEVAPSSDSVSNYNTKYAINLLEWEFGDYEKDDDEENTVDSVHTSAQFSINNDEVKNTKSIKVDDTFDPFKIEYIKNQYVNETTALESDNDIIGIDGVPIAPNTRKGFGASMTHQIDDNGNVKILKSTDLPSWSLLGFGIDGDFDITEGYNAGSYTVSEIEDAVLTLTPVSPSSQSDEGAIYTVVEYPLTDVFWTNRTNEGFDVIENLLSPNDFSNLKYTIRRCFEDWEPYISTCAEYISENPKNTKFINNGSLVTQFEGGAVYTEDGDIELNDIQPAILTPRTYDVTVIAEYDEVLDIIRKYQNIDTVGGYIRVDFVSGEMKKLHPMTLGYTWATKELNIVGEERKQPDNVVITVENETTYINNNPYEEVNYEMSGNFVALYDANSVKIVNFTKYDKFVIQEETFDNPQDLVQAIIDL